MSKRQVLLLILILAVSSLKLVESTSAQSTPTPSVPEFTAKFVNASYTITTTNPYTGLDETQQISNNSIEIIIRYEPFDYLNNGLTYLVYFDVRVKPRFSDNWTEIYPLQNRTSSCNADGTFSYAEYVSPDSPTQPNSSDISISFPVVPTELYGASGYDVQRHYSGYEGEEGRYFAFLSGIPDGAQLDFQIETSVGYASQRWVINHPLYPWLGGHFTPAIAYDGTSSWSNTQTITIGESQTPTPSPAATPFPTNYTGVRFTETEIIISAIIAAIVIGTGLGFLIYLIKRT